MAVEFHAGRWTIRYYRKGRKDKRPRIVLPSTITTREEALAYEELWRQRTRKARTDRMPSSTPISTLWERYEREHVKLYLAPTTAKDVAGTWFLHLAPHFGATIIGDLTDADVTDYIRNRLAERCLRKSETTRARTINKEVSYFSGFLTWCRDGAHIIFDEIKIKYLKAPRPLPLVLTPAETATFLLCAEERYRALFGCLYGMGLRIDEARALKWEDVDLAGGAVILTDPKGGTPRLMPLPRWVAESLAAIRPEHATGYVFANPRTGKPFVNITRAIARTREAAKITKRVTAHLLRHSMATHQLALNIPTRTIQAQLGHKRLETTEWYTHVSIDHLRSATDTFNQALTAEISSRGGTISPVAPLSERKREKALQAWRKKRGQ